MGLISWAWIVWLLALNLLYRCSCWKTDSSFMFLASSNNSFNSFTSFDFETAVLRWAWLLEVEGLGGAIIQIFFSLLKEGLLFKSGDERVLLKVEAYRWELLIIHFNLARFELLCILFSNQHKFQIKYNFVTFNFLTFPMFTFLQKVWWLSGIMFRLWHFGTKKWEQSYEMRNINWILKQSALHLNLIRKPFEMIKF